MPNILDATGLTLDTKAELITNYTTAYQQIYGTSINLASNSPDGQMMNVYIQTVLDVQDLIAAVYNSFDPDNAVGNALYQRVAINGIQVQAGTYTVTPVTLVNTTSVNLYGLDQSAQTVYTVADAAGNLWQLQTTQLGLAAGTHVLNFQAALPGSTTTTPNTITVQATVVLGVTSVNNPTSYTTLGLDQESDAALKIRRQKSVSLASQGYLPGLLAALENIPGMSAAFVYENKTGTDTSDAPAHSIWVITSGSATPQNIATAIYTKRNAGCGLKGSQAYNYLQVDGSIFVVNWDNVIPINLFIQFTATSLNGTNSPNIAAIRPGLVTSFVPGVAAEVNINALATDVQAIDSNTLVTNSGFSTGQSQLIIFNGIATSGTFFINYNGNLSAAINAASDNAATIQTKVQAMPGLAGALVTGSFSSALFTLNLSAITSVAALIFVPIATNTLMTAGSVAVVAAYSYNYSNTLNTASKQYQFVVSAPNITITAMELLPATSTVTAGSSVTFAAYGGYGAYTYSILTSNSGSPTINATTGVYTSGTTSNRTDTIKVVDVQGNLATATVTTT